jgi:hypothetical protein
MSRAEWRDDCLVFTGPTLPKGYGVTGKGGRGTGNVLVHRAVWEHHHGPIPEGLWVRHSCDNPPCVRIEHLLLGTEADNRQDMYERERTILSPLKTHCIRNHEFTEENTYRPPSRPNTRHCRECRRVRRAAQKEH